MHKLRYLAVIGLVMTMLPACAAGSMAAQKDAAMSPMAEPSMGPMEAIAEEPMAGDKLEIDGADIDTDERIARNDDAPPPPAPPPPPPGAGMPATPKPAPPKSATDASAQQGEALAIRGPMLIYTAEITMAVFEVNASLAGVEALGRELGGFMARRDDQSITIRVPVSRFEEAVRRVEKLGDMIHRNVVAQDVTEEFHDLDVRLKSARAVQDRLIQLLAKATKVEESVMIERELARVTGEIERLEGRMKFLRDRAAYSTLTVSFQPRRAETIRKGPFRIPATWLYQIGLGRLLNL